MKLILSVCFILFTYSLNAQKVKVYLTLNPLQCAGCNNAITHTTRLDTSIAVSFVFQKKYQADSAFLVEEFFLDKYNYGFIWSDSLYDKFILDKGISSASYISSDGNYTHKIDIRNLMNIETSKGMNIEFDFMYSCNKLNKLKDTIQFESKVFTPGVVSFTKDYWHFYF